MAGQDVVLDLNVRTQEDSEEHKGGDIYLSRGTKVSVGGVSYRLVRLLCMRWDLYPKTGRLHILNPLADPEDDKSPYLTMEDRFPPVLEDGDFEQYAREHVASFVSRYHFLRSLEDPLRGQNKKDFSRLDSIFQPV